MWNFLSLTNLLSTQSLNFFKPTETVFILLTYKSSTFVLKLLKLVGTLVSLSMSSLPTSAFKAIKSFLAAKSDASMPIAYSYSFLVV